MLDIGGRDVNGTCRHLFPNARYVTLDALEGPNVDIVADAAEWTPTSRHDFVLCTEVFEHTERWPDICVTAYKACRTGGTFLVTAAGPGRSVHSGISETADPTGEWYENIDPDRLRKELEAAGWQEIEVDVAGLDVRATARRL